MLHFKQKGQFEGFDIFYLFQGGQSVFQTTINPWNIVKETKGKKKKYF